MLTEMDGLRALNGVVVIAATNRPDIMDPALLRPGRFDKSILIGPPDKGSRVSIFGIHTRDKPLADDVNIEELAERTEGCTGADISAICNEAVMTAVRELVASGKLPTDDEIKGCRVRMEFFVKAIDKFGPNAREELGRYSGLYA
jgi:transitional endoplasmic reticulum ATPase